MMIKLKGKDAKPFRVTYRLPLGCRNDDYLWGFFWGSRFSFLKSYNEFITETKDPEEHIAMIDYTFPKHWSKKIEERLVE